MTANQVISAAYRKVGIKTPTTEEYTTGLEALNNMIGSWSAEGLMIPYNTIDALTLVAGKASYTIGSGGEFNAVRPLRIINAFIRDTNSDDHILDVTMTENEYNEIALKDAESRPERLYYDPQYPLGKIYFDYEPTDAETLYLISEKALTELASINTDVSLPDFYKECLVYNLAIRLADDLDFQLMSTVIQTAMTSKNTLENINAVNKLFKTSKMDNAMTYNLYRG